MVNVISRKVIDDYINKHADVKGPLLSWYKEVSKEKWETSQDIKIKYRSASFLKENTVIFNIKGNKYRIVVKIAYKTKTVFVKWIGTHAEYDRKIFMR